MLHKKLDLGYGPAPKDGFKGVDIAFKGPNIVSEDVLTYLFSIQSSTIQEIYSRHYFEHVKSDDFKRDWTSFS